MHGTQMAASRKGRKRHPGERYPSGDLKPAAMPMTLTRQIAAYARLVRDKRLNTALGHLRLHDELTDAQVEAGQRFGVLVGQHDRVQGLPARSAASPSYERGYGIAIAAIPEDPETVARVRQRYEAARACLPTRALSVVLSVCLDDHIPDDWEGRRHLNLGLAALAVHFRMI